MLRIESRSSKTASRRHSRPRSVGRPRKKHAYVPIDSVRARCRSLSESVVDCEHSQQVELAKQAEEQAQLSLQRELERKKAALPEEPPADAPNAVCLGFQLRDGTRLMRRFRLDSPMQIVYDYVDTHQAQFKSGSYVLVANYPRRTYRDTSITIADSGIHTDEVLFLSEL